jgi:hypothetical protein
MPKAIPKRTFLLKKDVIAHKGVALEVTAEELKKFKSDLIQLKK